MSEDDTENEESDLALFNPLWNRIPSPGRSVAVFYGEYCRCGNSSNAAKCKCKKPRFFGQVVEPKGTHRDLTESEEEANAELHYVEFEDGTEDFVANTGPTDQSWRFYGNK